MSGNWSGNVVDGLSVLLGVWPIVSYCWTETGDLLLRVGVFLSPSMFGDVVDVDSVLGVYDKESCSKGCS